MKLLYLAACMLLLAGIAGADVVVEHSGRQWNGEILETTETVVVIRTNDGLEIRIPRDRIARISYSNQAPPTQQQESPHGRRFNYIDDGRVQLAVWGTGYGVANAVLLTALGDGGSDAYALAALTGGAVGFAAPWIWSKKRDVSDGRATLMTFGGSWGMWQGFGWPVALIDSPSKNEEILPTVLVGAAGLVTAGYLTSKYDVSDGDAELIRSVPGWSSIYWLWACALADVDDARFLIGSTLAAGDVGIGVGALLARTVEFSRNDVRLINVGGILGALTGGAIIAIANIDNEKTAFSTVMIGSIVGTGFAWWALSPNQVAEATNGMHLGLTAVRSPENSRRMVPALGMRINF